MKVFWREEPLTDNEADLLRLCLEAHSASALRDNLSSITMAQCAASGVSFPQALSASLSTLGGKHAPLAFTFQVFQWTNTEIIKAIGSGATLAGWGNSLVKDAPDDLWMNVDEKLSAIGGDWYSRMQFVTAEFHKIGKKIFPNPSAYTVMVAHILKIPASLASWLFIAGRLNSWAAIYQRSDMKGAA